MHLNKFRLIEKSFINQCFSRSDGVGAKEVNIYSTRKAIGGAVVKR